MGDLSIVIEDESNMINLWDFAHNPAAFLFDEKGSVIRGDFIWDTYQMDSLPYYRAYYPLPIFKFKANGDFLDNWISLTFRKDGNFALGLGGEYFFRQTNSEWDDHELRYPDVLLVFSKSVSPQTCFGANLRYVYYDFEFSRVKHYGTVELLQQNQETVKGFRTEVGMTRKLDDWTVLGATLGYERLRMIWDYLEYWYHSGPPDLSYFPCGKNISHIGWLSGQAVVEIVRKIRLGMEGTFQLSDLQRYEEKEARLCLRLRGIYDPLPQLRLGVFFSDGYSFTEYRDPIYSYFSSIRDDIFTKDLGGGFALKFSKRVLAGVEYHYRDYPQPSYQGYPWDLKTHSVNLGVEGKLSEALFLRGGYINSTFVPKSDYDQTDSWENILTLGLGLGPLESNLIFEFSCRYALKKYKDWYGNWDVESETRALSFSFKKVL